MIRPLTAALKFFPVFILIGTCLTVTTVPQTAFHVSAASGSLPLWVRINDGLPETSISNLVIAPSDPRVLYASSEHSLFKSSNAGEHWEAITGLPGVGGATALAIDPENPDVVYASHMGLGADSYKTIDGGLTWDSLHIPAETASLVVAPSSSNTVYAGEYGPLHRIFRSTDAGKTWSNSVVPSLATPACFDLLVVDPTDARILYIAERWEALLEGFNVLMKSTDGGASWSGYSGHDKVGGFAALVINPRDSTTLFAGMQGPSDSLIESMDANANWSPTSLAEPMVTALAIHPNGPNILYAGTTGRYQEFSKGHGIWRSTDSGVSWTPLNAGLGDLFINRLVVAATFPATVYAATRSGIFKLVDADVSSPESFRLSLSSTTYCVGRGWDLRITGGVPNDLIRLFGTSNGVPWEVVNWRQTGDDGGRKESGTFAPGSQGDYTLRVAVGDMASNTVSFRVSTCASSVLP